MKYLIYNLLYCAIFLFTSKYIWGLKQNMAGCPLKLFRVHMADIKIMQNSIEMFLFAHLWKN